MWCSLDADRIPHRLEMTLFSPLDVPLSLSNTGVDTKETRAERTKEEAGLVTLPTS